MVGGENIAEINCRQLREHIRVILQENYVFDSSIVKNMGYLSDCSEAEIDEMCRALGLEEVVKSNAGDLGENLNTVSGGERQRINIGRSLLCPFDMLLMDEPTSALDPEITAEILRVMKELAAEKMTMVIDTHEIQFAKAVSDRVIFMDGGVVVEEGTPGQVIDCPENDRTRSFLQKLQVWKNVKEAAYGRPLFEVFDIIGNKW